MRALRIERPLLDQMIDHCLAAFPEEGCGLLSGRGERVTSVLPATNAAAAPREAFALAPAEQLRLFREIARRGEELVGIFHSHPRSEPVPSRRDIESAFYPEVAYVIITLVRGPVVRVFRIDRARGAYYDLPLITSHC
ncbi:MAG TPA: M67 family metallopeptidase [Limnochordia bacterium]